MSPSSPDPSFPKTSVELFRTRSTRQPIHPLENALLWSVAAQLVFLPWALGGMRAWAQEISLGLGLFSFFLALLPRDYDGTDSGKAPFRLYLWPKLMRFPLFWLGALFLLYITLGALNPAWEYQTDGKTWWMREIGHQPFLPVGVRVPFEMWGPWRMLMIYASVWLSVCAVWIGFTRRRALQALFTVLAANAFLLAALGIAQRATDADKMFWFWKPPAAYFVSSFIYKNHAGAYFNLLLALCAGLAFWHYERSLRRLDKSSPAGLFAFFGTAVAMVIFFSYSRTATLLMFAFLLLTFGVFVWRIFIKGGPEKRSPLMLVMLVVSFIAFVRIGMVSLRTERFVYSMNQLQQALEQDRPGTRTLAAQATLDMAYEKLLTGWGAGSFRFLFPTYQQKYPRIFFEHGRRLFFDHAHNDYVEFLAEFGVIGCVLLLVAAGFTALRAIRLHTPQNPLALFVLLGCGITLVHCVVDFNFYNPAIFTTWCVLLLGIIRWVELEEAATAG